MRAIARPVSMSISMSRISGQVGTVAGTAPALRNTLDLEVSWKRKPMQRGSCRGRCATAVCVAEWDADEPMAGRPLPGASYRAGIGGLVAPIGVLGAEAPLPMGTE